MSDAPPPPNPYGSQPPVPPPPGQQPMGQQPMGGQPPGQQPPTQPMQGPPGGYLAAPTSTSKGFFGALFDFSFTHFVTPMIVKAVYILATIGLVLGWLVILVSAFTQSAGFGLVVFILGPIALVIYLALIRMTLEFYLAVVRMSEDIHKRLPG